MYPPKKPSKKQKQQHNKQPPKTLQITLLVNIHVHV